MPDETLYPQSDGSELTLEQLKDKVERGGKVVLPEDIADGGEFKLPEDPEWECEGRHRRGAEGAGGAARERLQVRLRR